MSQAMLSKSFSLHLYHSKKLSYILSGSNAEYLPLGGRHFETIYWTIFKNIIDLHIDYHENQLWAWFNKPLNF